MSNRTADFILFLNNLFLALFCAMVSALIACLLVEAFPPVRDVSHLLPAFATAWVNAAGQKYFMLLTYAIGFAAVVLSSARLKARSPMFGVRDMVWMVSLFSVLLMSLMVFMPRLASGSFSRYPLALVGVTGLFLWYAAYRRRPSVGGPSAYPSRLTESTRFGPGAGLPAKGLPRPVRLAGDIAACAAMVVIVFPSNFTGTVAGYAFDTHLSTFAVGLAPYFYGDHLIPGIDYFSIYGVGFGFVASLLKGATYAETLYRFSLLYLVMIAGFYCVFYFILTRLYRSRLAAFLTVAFGFILSCHGGMYFDPSSWPVRYFMVPFVILAYVAYMRGRTWPTLSALGVFLGLSLFLNTEVGIMSLAASLASCLVLERRGAPLLKALCAITLSSVAWFFFFAFAVYGVGVFSRQFVHGLFQPLLVFSGGYSTKIIEWNLWVTIAVFFLQLAAIATLGWARARYADFRGREYGWDVGVLVMTALIGLGLILRWASRGFNVIAIANLFLLCVVFFWWVRYVLCLFFRNGVGEGVSRLRRSAYPLACVGLSALACCVLFVWVVRPGSTYPLAGTAWAQYGSLVKGLVVGDCASFSYAVPDLGSIPPADLELITQNSRPEERVLILSGYAREMAYYFRARRAPKWHAMPCNSLILRENQTRSFENVDTMFVALDAGGHFSLPRKRYSLDMASVPLDEFYVAGRGITLIHLRRSGNQTEVRHENTRQRVKDLEGIKGALEEYHRRYGRYPASGPGTDTAADQLGSGGPRWIKGLVPEFLDRLSSDFRYPISPEWGYHYASDGTDYKLVCIQPPAPSNDIDQVERYWPGMVDPARPGNAFGYWTVGAAEWLGRP